jgi:hypothetical protein
LEKFRKIREKYIFFFKKIGLMHRLMSTYAGQVDPSQSSPHVFNMLRNWLMLVPMRLADPANHQRMLASLPSKATLVNELDELELVSMSHYINI